ncbi:dynein regulatory complex protein 10-like [Dendronephthya gigantea]|uniref:dynein regulatory complex protein 10-like n=1 Tax=Dendronephthya gigantea TaxID=151771 RepID=UPI001068EDC3|nr:dynein regulatory complex protein 10-like [Dendronephthya gigantea]XP_028415907.1 dynein regulatory complex protein 10-like [Dendronephthya gigantea]
MAAPILEPIRMVKMPSTASSASETQSRIHEKVHRFKSGDIADPLKVLEPERKKLTSLESQRIMAVLEDTIRRIEVSTILPFVVENLGRFSILLGAELTHLLREHDSLQGRYQKAVSQLHLDEKRLASLQEKFDQQKKEKEAEFFLYDEQQTLDVQNDDGLSALDVNLADGKVKKEEKMVDFLRGQLQQSLRTILRLFVRNPTALDALRNEKRERSPEAKEMLMQLDALKGTLFERLLRTPSELKERDSYLRFITERERKLSKQAKKLQDELNIATEDKENELSKRNEVIRKIKFDIFHVEQTSKETNQQVINEATKEQLAEEKNSEGKRLRLQQDIIEEKKLIETSIGKHRENELALRKKKYKVETEVENWIQKYDTDMGERQNEFDQLDEIYTEEKKQLNELEERFRTMEKEYQEIVEQKKIAREKAEDANRELQAKIKAATLIQSFWRALKARKQLKNKKKKGKKGKKGGKRK